MRAVRWHEVERPFGGVNVLVNNAGILSVSTVESISEDDWDRVIDTNLKGPFLMSRAVLPAFRRAGGGTIVNIGSVLGLIAMKDRAAYCASKGGVTLLTKAMALDHAHENIRVNCICPSIVETELVKGPVRSRPKRDGRHETPGSARCRWEGLESRRMWRSWRHFWPRMSLPGSPVRQFL